MHHRIAACRRSAEVNTGHRKWILYCRTSSQESSTELEDTSEEVDDSEERLRICRRFSSDDENSSFPSTGHPVSRAARSTPGELEGTDSESSGPLSRADRSPPGEPEGTDSESSCPPEIAELFNSPTKPAVPPSWNPSRDDLLRPALAPRNPGASPTSNRAERSPTRGKTGTPTTPSLAISPTSTGSRETISPSVAALFNSPVTLGYAPPNPACEPKPWSLPTKPLLARPPPNPLPAQTAG